jgi:O-succinylbenzoate synthase
MRKLTDLSPIPIALDEELIGSFNSIEKKKMLQEINPQFLILKPGIMGGFAEADEWIKLGKELGIEWWATSALESNIGLNAIAQWAVSKEPGIIHGLGTGAMYKNNISSPLKITNGELFYDPEIRWEDESN